MDKTTQDISPQTEREFMSSFSPKRPRTMQEIDNHSEKKWFDFPNLLTFRKTIDSTASKSTPEENVDQICPSENVDIQDEKPYEQPQDTKIIVTHLTKVRVLSTSHTEDVDAESSEVCFVNAEGCLLHLGNEEQPPVTESDKLSSCLLDDTGGALAESHTSEKASTDLSSNPDYRQFGKSLQGKDPDGCCLPAGNDKNGRQVQHYVSQIQAFTLSSSNEEVRCQSDCTDENVLYNTWSQSAEFEAGNQKQDEHGFSENILFSKEADEGNSPISYQDYADSKSFCSNTEENPSGNLAEDGTNEEKILELQPLENENVTVCDRETKGQVNENCVSENSVSSASEYAKGSLVSYDVVLTRNIATEKVRLEMNDFCGAKEEPAAGKMIVKAWSETADHKTETPMSSRISQVSAEGDNDAGPFSVIDPAVWCETDRDTEEKCCSSESTAGVESSPSLNVCEMETPFPLSSDTRTSEEASAPNQNRQVNHQSTTLQCKDEKEKLCQPYTEPQACSITSSKRDTITSNEASCNQKGFEEETNTDEHVNSRKAVESDREFLQQNKLHEEVKSKISAGDWTEEKGSECGNKDELEKKLECFSDHPYSADISMMVQTTEERQINKVQNVGEEMKTDRHESSEILVKSEDDMQQQKANKTDTTEASHVECSSEWTEGNIGKSGNKLLQASQHGQGKQLSCFPSYQHRGETSLVENADDILAFAFPLTSDAVVPCQHDLSHSENADMNPTAPKCNGRFSPVPSGFIFCDQVPEGFEKIQLSPHNDDDDDPAALGSSPFLTSLPQQLWKIPQQQLPPSMPEAESDRQEETPEGEEEVGEGEVERIQCHNENVASDFLNSDTCCNGLPNFTSAADVIALGWPEPQPHCESPCDSSEHIQDEVCTQSVSDYPEFQMKKQFDVVLKEITLFFEVSKGGYASDRASSPEQCNSITEPLEADPLNCEEDLSSPDLACHRHPSTGNAEEDRSLEMCGGESVVSCTAGGGDGEQEVPLGNQCSKTSVSTPDKYREPHEMEHRRKMWSPSSVCLPFIEHRSHRPQEQSMRPGPLRTCTRPIRVGLSKRAKTKHLHYPHPYK